ncbi:prepilin-type N-terminal cleavage/methylation domain-containing protein [Sphingomonas sp. BT-65]|uniref:prepilin-type N-terminal cleavage/methylation domain-containing protein n=1 Tax=Sphingomonas sp. BT-65 TaxID=2989821 RepID=UPI00223590B9|nr:prepilin-type N-terminal cleavage/methylation domain-containing protein [Sphingomonas sp. BT-65]MCW4460105.1 prepilin-type N-terminal cleavage/methylation domain-containing protein [Sphingomonas sp. BT-65]
MRGERISNAERGMTLIEMLIVLVIIGIAAGGIALGVGAATRAPSVETEARRLALRLQAAADDAMIGDRILAFTAERHGYGFAAIGRDGSMKPLGDALAPHTLPAGITVTIDVQPPLLLGVDGGGKPMSALVENGADKWLVRYDGMTATATKVEAAS